MDGVVEAGAAPGLQRLHELLQPVDVARELRAALDALVELHHQRRVHVLQLVHEGDGGLLQEAHVVRHAAAGVEHQHHRERDLLLRRRPRPRGSRRPPARTPSSKTSMSFGPRPRTKRPRLVVDDRRHRDHVDVHLEREGRRRRPGRGAGDWASAASAGAGERQAGAPRERGAERAVTSRRADGGAARQAPHDEEGDEQDEAGRDQTGTSTARRTGRARSRPRDAEHRVGQAAGERGRGRAQQRTCGVGHERRRRAHGHARAPGRSADREICHITEAASSEPAAGRSTVRQRVQGVVHGGELVARRSRSAVATPNRIRARLVAMNWNEGPRSMKPPARASPPTQQQGQPGAQAGAGGQPDAQGQRRHDLGPGHRLHDSRLGPAVRGCQARAGRLLRLVSRA